MKKNYISPKIKSREIDLRDSLLLQTSQLQVDTQRLTGNGYEEDDF